MKFSIRMNRLSAKSDILSWKQPYECAFRVCNCARSISLSAPAGVTIFKQGFLNHYYIRFFKTVLLLYTEKMSNSILLLRLFIIFCLYRYRLPKNV